MSRLTYHYSQDLEIIADVDVVVVGSGPGGLGAAVTAGRSGASVAVVERYGFPGGMASVGEVQPFMPSHVQGRCLDRPVYVEWAQRMRTYLPAAVNEAHPFQPDLSTADARLIDKHAAMLAAEDMLVEANCELFYHHQLFDVIAREGRIEAIVLMGKGGLVAMRAKVFVDATGDGDLAARSGCEFQQGGPSGHTQPMSLCFKLADVDVERLRKADKDVQARYRQSQSQGDIQNPREDILWFPSLGEGVVHFNSTRVVQLDPTDSRQLAAAERIARDQVRELLAWLRREAPGCEQARLVSMAHQIGVRESRRVSGRARLDRDAFEQARKCPDAIARCQYNIDIHNPDGSGTEHMFLSPGEFYEIPYGCIVAADVENLLMGCRAISVDHAIHSSLRVMPTVISIGQGAGMAAAMSVRQGVLPGELSGEDVRKALVDFGAAL